MDHSEKQAFRDLVYQTVVMIPPGRATSYGAIARAAGFPSLSRMVGRFMGECDGSIPAHRVVNSSGVLTAAGAFGSPGRMRELLEAEGVEVARNRIRNWKKVFWDPMQEIDV